MKKMKVKLSNKKIIISIAVAAVLVLIAVFIIFRAFGGNQAINGDWELVVNPEKTDAQENAGKAYYTFSKPGEHGDGEYKTIFDGGVEEGAYRLSENDGKRYIYLGTVDLEYSIKRQGIFGNTTLTITYPAQSDEETGEITPAQDYVFIRSKAPDYEKEAFSSFETDEVLIGEWATKERTLSYLVNEVSYIQTVHFNDNGIMTIRYESVDLMLDRIMYYAYTARDGLLTFSLVTDKQTKYTVSYEVNSDGNLIFTQDDTSGSIFADAFFSDVTYYANKAPVSADSEKTSDPN